MRPASAWEPETQRRVPDLPLLSLEGHYLLRHRQTLERARLRRRGKMEEEEVCTTSRSSGAGSMRGRPLWSEAEVEEAHQLLYAGVVRNSRRFVDKLLDEPYVDVNVKRFGENLLMTAIRHGHEDMARFLIENGVDFNASRTLLERRINRETTKEFLNWYTVSCRQLAYDKGLFDVVQLIDYLNGELYPFLPPPPYNPRLREPRLGMFSSVVSIPEALFDETRAHRPISGYSFTTGPSRVDSEPNSARTDSTRSSGDTKAQNVRFDMEGAVFGPLGPADLKSLVGKSRITPVLGRATHSATLRSASRSTVQSSLRSRSSPNSSASFCWTAPIRETKSSVLRKAINVNSHDLPVLSRRKRSGRVGLRDALFGACIET